MTALAIAERVASWGGAVVPARVNMGPDGWHKGSIKAWPARATSDRSAWPPDWFTWGGNWHVALCPRVAGLVALDLDGPEAVELAREAIALQHLRWHDVNPPLSYRTPGHGGGVHVVWRWPRGLPAFSRMLVTLAGGAQIDLRGEGTFLLLCGAPRPDLPEGARDYVVTSRPGVGGPPEAPPNLVDWMESLGDLNIEDAPSLGGKQLAPEGLEAMAAKQGGKLKTDRHVALFRVASYLRVRHGTRTFEQLAAALWELAERNFDFGEEGEEAWQTEVIRVARNASRYTEERDRQQAEAATAALRALGLGR